MELATIRDEAEALIAAVREEHAKALAELEGRWWQTEATKAAIGALKSLAPPIEAWAARGLAAIDADKSPGANGWPGWTKAGKTLIEGIGFQNEIADTATLENLTQTFDDAVRDVERVAAKAASTAKRAAREVGETVGEAAGAATKPLVPLLGIVAVGLVAVAAIVIKRG